MTTEPQSSADSEEPAAWRWPTAGGGYYFYDGQRKPANGAEPLYLRTEPQTAKTGVKNRQQKG